MIRACLNQDIDRQPFWFMFGPWGETMERWRGEGFVGDDWRAAFGFDAGFMMLPVNLGFCPRFERIVLAEDDETRTVRDALGITFVEKKGHATIPRFLDNPIKTRGDWETIKRERLNPHAPERFPANWNQAIRAMKERDAAVQIGGYPFGLFGTLRDFMGVERLLLAFYDEPELIHEMMDFLTDFWLAIYERALKDIQIDHIHIWEDMSGKQGPLISPAMFRQFMTPNYERIVAFAKRHGISVVSVDTDGNVDILMPLFQECGMNLVLPFEVQAGCDVVALREQYPGICLHGGIDKRALALGFGEIDGELDRIGGMFGISGYIAAPDHLIHPEVSLENFQYFIERLKERIGIVDDEHRS